MSEEQYIELYKKYRPSKWKDLIGQEKIAKSLQTAILRNKVPTAYLFSGPRGTGKSSASFILAKAVNCENIDAQANPCNECEICVNIDNGTQLGVNYISMANKGSVDDIREIVKEAMISQPVKKTVYILDEVHSISRSAFDALLIPLEDPNMNALFLFASTEIQKIPAPILSRVQSRKLNLVDSSVMAEHIKSIAEKENIDISDLQISEIVKQGRGSVRDTIGALESAISYDEESEESVDYSIAVIKAISESNLSSALKNIADAISDGNTGKDLAELIFSDLRDLLLSISGADEELINTIPVDDPQKIAKGLLGNNGIFTVAEEIGDAITSMSIGTDSRIILEIAIVKSISKLKKIRKALLARKES